MCMKTEHLSAFIFCFRICEDGNKLWKSMAKVRAVKLMLLTILLGRVGSDLLIIPKDTEALVGSTTYFNCSTTISSSEIHWFHYKLGFDQDRSLVYGYDKFYSPYDTRYEINKNAATGEFNLIISSVTTDDAGKFECQDDFGRGSRKSAELVVLESPPVCQSNARPEGIVGENRCGIEPENLLLSCTVKYKGKQHPVMEWRKSGTEIPISDGVKWNASGDSVTYTLAMTGSSDIDDATFRCHTTKSVTVQPVCNPVSVKVVGSKCDTCIVLGVLLAFTTAVAIIIPLLVWWISKRKLGSSRYSEQNRKQSNGMGNRNDYPGNTHIHAQPCTAESEYEIPRDCNSDDGHDYCKIGEPSTQSVDYARDISNGRRNIESHV